jgi:hypothetical protein
LIIRNPTAKPEFKKTVAGVTAKSVIENFIKAIGGLQAVLPKSTANGSYYPQHPPSYTSKVDAKGKLLVELSRGN